MPVTNIQDVCPGDDVSEETRRKLDGSPVIFYLCTPSLMEDRGMAHISLMVRFSLLPWKLAIFSSLVMHL